MTNFKIKNMEDLEDREKWENIFAWEELPNGPIWAISKAYQKLNLDNFLWESIHKDMKKVQNVSKAEYGWKWVKDKLIPDIENGIREIKKNKNRVRLGWPDEIIIEILKAVLKVAQTCVKYKRPMEITL